jgi:predicted XRE-type DNA-binding protein
MRELMACMKECNLEQFEAAEILCVTRPFGFDVMNLKAGKFTLCALVDMRGASVNS